MSWEPALVVWQRATTPEEQIAARDLFAVGIYLSSIGKHDAGIKACWAALQGIGASINEIHPIISAASGDRDWIAHNVGPHAEILNLFE